ncbi:glycosyltransferase family 2 protein [Draconibacterium sp. IB214405]|uniref:glycosyltransferase family 2 protein n=1 Tax=Draconibacterium sp. IB214405 TaxID=3097352 RepID=UPI002A13189B|nr:glycosyltransferase family 2 protein [Draconibacterium sp. IB214405]MDX8341492.1 glycosyltransferase family 2 protein [Draconibacterium sp. IB214405]
MKTSIIVCTYNEEETIFNVVASCCKHNPDAEIIVVDDGSTDGTESVLETLAIHYKFDYLKLPENHGKSYAMAYGAEYASNEILLFINANLINLRKEHFKMLLSPIINQQADMVVGNPDSFTVDYSLNPYKTVMGEKAILKSDFLPIIKDVKEILFGVEAFITIYFQALGKKVAYKSLSGLEKKNTRSEGYTIQKPSSTNKEIANALISNIDLITKRIQNNIQHSQNYTQSTISSVQLQLNKYMKHLKEQIVKVETA